MINFLSTLLKYCKQQTLACKPISTYLSTFDGDDITSMNASIYDLAYMGKCPEVYCKTRLDALELIDYIKTMLVLSQDDIDVLRDNVFLYYDAVCRCLAMIDYKHILYKYDSKIDYDFYECCVREGVRYDRFYYITQISPELTSFLIQQGIFVHSKKYEFVASIIKKSRKSCLRGVALMLNDCVVAQIPGYDMAVDNKPDEYDKLIRNEEFKHQALDKLPDKLKKAIIQRDVKYLDGGKDANLTLLAFYISAIICQYGHTYFSVRMTDALFEKALGLSQRSLSKKRDKRLKEICSYKSDSNLEKVVLSFPKYGQKLTNK